MGAGNHPRTRKERERGPRHGGKGLHGRHQGPHPGRAHQDGETSAAPAPPNTPTHTTEPNIGRHTDNASARPPATGNHTENRGHTYTGRTGHTHRGSRRERRRTAHHHTLTARRRPRPPQRPPHRHQKRTAAAPTTTDRNPQRTRDQGTGPQGGLPHGPSRDHTMGYKGQAALPSRFDAEYCYAIGLTAGGLISAGLTSVRASITNLLRPVEEWHCGGTPIPSMMNFERHKGK